MQRPSPPLHQPRYGVSFQQFPITSTLSASTSSLLISNSAPKISSKTKEYNDTPVYGPCIPPNRNLKLTNNSAPSSAQANAVDLRRLILFNLPVDLVPEYLELYLEHLSGEAEIERIDYSNLDDTTVMVTFKTELDMNEVRRRHNIRPKLNNSEISLAEVMPPATVMLKNLPADISRDVLELYFSNRRRSDGGQVTDVTFDNEHHALVTFANYKDVRRIIKREHSIHDHRLDVRIYYKYMGIEPFLDASNIDKKPDPIRYDGPADSRYLFLLKNRPLLDELRLQLQTLNAEIDLEAEGSFEITYSGARSTIKRRLQWAKDVENLVEQFLNERLTVHKVPWDNKKIPTITSAQLEDLSLKDNTRLLQLSDSDYIIVTALKDHLDRTLSELTDMLTSPSKTTKHTIPLNDAIYRSKPLITIRDPKVNNHRSSVLFDTSSTQNHTENIDLALQISTKNVSDDMDNLRLYQLDLLSMRFVDLARQAYTDLSIEINRNKRSVHFHGPNEQVVVCKSYFQTILNSIVYKHYKIGKEMALFLSNPDTAEIVINNLARSVHVCAYEIERINRNSVSPTFNSSNDRAFSSSHNSHSTSNGHHLLALYSLTSDTCDHVYDIIRQDIIISSIKLDKDDKHCISCDSWQAYVRDLYSNSNGFRRRRVLIQVKQNQLILVGFEKDVVAMRMRIYDYFNDNAISFYESE